MKFSIHFFLLIFLIPTWGFAQEDLLAELDEETDTGPQFVTSTFKSTRVINSQSVEMVPARHLDVRISHRFGKINSGAYNLWGLDQATIRLALEYGVLDWLNAGIGRSSFRKTFDGYLKIGILRQRTDEGYKIPFSMVWFSNMAVNSLKTTDEYINDNFSGRLSFAHQLIIASKISSFLSLQVSPTLVHYNYVPQDRTNNLFATAVGGRIKISKRVSLNADYIYRINPESDNGLYNSLSLGVDIETGGHVFQIHATNSQGMIEEYFIGQTTGRWNKGDIFYGFNISRLFSL